MFTNRNADCEQLVYARLAKGVSAAATVRAPLFWNGELTVLRSWPSGLMLGVSAAVAKLTCHIFGFPPGIIR